MGDIKDNLFHYFLRNHPDEPCKYYLTDYAKNVVELMIGKLENPYKSHLLKKSVQDSLNPNLEIFTYAIKTMYTTLAIFHEETLPYTTYIPTQADKLILGTFPTKHSLRKYDFFYPNPRNKFWKILARLAGAELCFITGESAVVERKIILDRLKLAIGDIGYRIYRQNESSLDSNIFPIEFTNVFKLLDEHPRIDTLILTSSTKGNSVLGWFKAYCKLNGVDLAIEKDNKVPWETTIWVKRRIRVLVIYSTSGAAGKSEAELVDMYSEAIRGLSLIK